VFVQTVQKLKFETFPPYLAPFDYHIFGSFKDALHGRQFKDALHGRQFKDALQGRQFKDALQGRQFKDALQGRQFKGNKMVTGVAKSGTFCETKKHSLHVASGSSWAGVTNMKGKCEITLKKGSEFVPMCHL
jgi:hypothetical protein